MKLTIAFLFMLCLGNVSFSAETNSDEISLQDTSVTRVNKEVLLSGDVSYTLRSNRVLLAERVDIWESRFLITFPEIISIDLSDVDQSIHLVLSENHTAESLSLILKRFKVVYYLIQT